jgi:hypothetical protein
MRDNPANTNAMVSDFARNGEYTDNEKKARLEGRFEFLGGRLIDNFDPKVHVIPSRALPADWVHICAADPHLRRPCALAWLAFDPVAKIYHVYRQRPAAVGTGEYHKMRDGALPAVELATVIRNAEGEVPALVRPVDPRFGPASYINNGYRETCFVDAMKRVGLNFDPQIPNTGSIEFGITRINDLLRYDRSAPVGPDNTPHLFIHDSCKDVINSFQRLGYLDVDDASKGGQRKLDETYKDFSDAVRYAILYPLPATAAQVKKLQRWDPDELDKEINDF